MTKKLEEEFNLPPIEEVTDTENVPTVAETHEVIEETQDALSVSEKINLAFKEIKGLEDHEVEMNDIAKKAINSYEQLMSLGMNVSDMAAGKVFAEASNMLKIALDASDAKTKAKLQQIDLMLKKARIDYDNRIVEGDSLYFDNNSSFASATNNITVTDTINNSVVKGHYAEVFKEKDSLFITKRALAITVQEKDSVYIHADKIMVTGKPDNRIIKAYYNAKIFKRDLSGKSDSIHSDQNTGVTKLLNLPTLSSGDKFSVIQKPILWNLGNQMTGDTIHLLSNKETEKIDSLLVFDNAFIISKDTISKNGYNQISGKRLVGLFDEENRLKRVDVTKNAESIFYARNDKQELIGIDKSKSGSITILFDDGDIDEYTRYNQIDGNLYPESKFPEKERILKGFDWREEERPRSVDDLFKDDPPLELPIIKGLDDYIPQEDFVDETLIKRIKKADTKAKIKKGTISKASRNLPKNTFKAKGVSKNKTLQKNKRKKFLLEKPLPEK